MSGASIGRIFLTSGRLLRVRADISGAQMSPAASLPTGWSTLKLCGTIGASGTWSLALNGTTVGTMTTNNGTAPFAQVQLGDETQKTLTVNFDDVVVTTP